MNNPLRYTDPNGRDEREGWKAGVVVNNSSQPVTIAGDVNGRVQVAQLQPGQSSTAVMQDADVIIPNNQTMSFIAGQEHVASGKVTGQTDGALKIGFGKVTVSDSPTKTLKLSGSIGYMLSFFGGRAGYVPPAEAKKNQWVVPPQQQQGQQTQTQQTQPPSPQQQQQQPLPKKKPEEERAQ